MDEELLARSGELTIYELLLVCGIVILAAGIVWLAWYIHKLHYRHSKEQKENITTMTAALSQVASSNEKVSDSIDNQSRMIDRLYDVIIKATK